MTDWAAVWCHVHCVGAAGIKLGRIRMLWNRWELRKLTYRGDSIFGTELLETKWFPVTDEPRLNEILEDDTCWYPTGELVIQKNKPED